MTFTSESKFEDAVVDALRRHGWEEVLYRPTEMDLLKNWSKILYENNRNQDRLGNVPLTETELDQILEKLRELRTPWRLNEFINGRTVDIRRDAPLAHNVGKEVSLKIYDRHEIAGGQSRYQIARQPHFATNTSELLPDRRGDLMLLINGMPVIHIELKRSGVPVSQACNQIAKYANEGVYRGIYSLQQVFVGMTPDETLYFANPGPDGKFNPDFYFHWADFNNDPIHDWQTVVTELLSIPMAHQLIGFYTVQDRASGVLMVMRSYQYYAAAQISDRVEEHDWETNNQLGGYIWHTTGSGKTVTSFKTAQLIVDSKNADKVVFLLDRVELGDQSVDLFRNYGGKTTEVENTPDSQNLLTLLKRDSIDLIVTSIQKMSLLTTYSIGGADLDNIRNKRIVVVVDEAHRSTFGEMLADVKETLPGGLFFGFTGTPIHDENQKKHSTTTTIFGNELHRYSIADGIRDGNVLGFDPEMVETYPANELREQVALHQAKAQSPKEAMSDPDKREIYLRFKDKGQVEMAGTVKDDGSRVKGIEDYIPTAQYQRSEHWESVVSDIASHWIHLSRNSAFHSILATSSISEAIEYYRIFKEAYPQFQVTALFDPNIDNSGDDQLSKEDGLIEILEDYNERYGTHFTFSSHKGFKKDVSARLAHKWPYNTRDFTHDKQIDLLIVVDQMLTGFDSKWLNTLYLDKTIEFENIIQAFSRTNRVFGPEKPFGSVRYYRRPYTMEKNVERAVKLYSGDKPFGLFVERLNEHLIHINLCFDAIKALFKGHPDFSDLPEGEADRGEFARQFSRLYEHLQSAQVQGFTWNKSEYEFDGETIVVELDESSYFALVARYKELASSVSRPEGVGGGGNTDSVPFDVNAHISHIDTDRIDSEYLNSKFVKYVRALNEGMPSAEISRLREDLHSSFARLSSEDQKFANRWLHDLQSGEVSLEDGKTVQDYINDYRLTERDREINLLVENIGVDAVLLAAILDGNATSANLNEYGRFDSLKEAVDSAKAKSYFESREGGSLSKYRINILIDKTLRNYILFQQLPEDLRSSEQVD